MELSEGVHLVRTGDRVDQVDALGGLLGDPVGGRVGGLFGGRVGVEGVLGDLNRNATETTVPGRAPEWGFTWNAEDNRSLRWFPQGITTSADQGDQDDQGDQGPVAGRDVVCTSAHSQEIGGVDKGSRVTFVDITTRSSLRYRHVLLVEAAFAESGELELHPVRAHAGGIVWHGPYLHVAGTTRGIYSFRLDDIMRVARIGDPSSLGVHPSGAVDSFGYRYVLPVRFTYDAGTPAGHEAMTYSFLSLDRSTSPPHLVAGEYGRGTMPTRLVRYELDPSTSLLRTSVDGVSRPLFLATDGVEGMQGATVVEGTYYVTTSSGRYTYGSLYVGQPGAFTCYKRVLPIGVEDITYWPSRDELWSLTEYPTRRYVFSMPRPSLGRA